MTIMHNQQRIDAVNGSLDRKLENLQCEFQAMEQEGIKLRRIAEALCSEVRMSHLSPRSNME